MEIVGLPLLVGVLALSVYAYYFLANIAYAIWRPDKAKIKWVRIAELGPIQSFRPIFKWVFPASLLIIVISLASSLAARIVWDFVR